MRKSFVKPVQKDSRVKFIGVKGNYRVRIAICGGMFVSCALVINLKTPFLRFNAILLVSIKSEMTV